MPVFAPFKNTLVKVPNSRFVKTENEPAKEEAKSTDIPVDQPVNPTQPEAE